MNAYDQHGITKHIKFDENGDVEVENVAIWAYKIVRAACSFPSRKSRRPEYSN